MNTSPQAISKILNAAGIPKRKLARGRICMMGSEGYQVEKNWRGEVTVDYFARTSSFVKWEDFQPIREAAITKILEVLQNKGYVVSKVERGYVVSKVSA